MKMKLFVLFASLFFVQIVIAQSVVISSRKVAYERPKPTSDLKKIFSVNYPKVKAANAALSKKIERSIGFEQNLTFSLKEGMGGYQWLDEADFSVGYNQKGVLSIDLSLTGTAAYPTWLHKNVVVDLKTGSKVEPREVFKNLDGLIAKIKAIQNEEMKQGSEEVKNDSDLSDENTD